MIVIIKKDIQLMILIIKKNFLFSFSHISSSFTIIASSREIQVRYHLKEKISTKIGKKIRNYRLYIPQPIYR